MNITEIINQIEEDKKKRKIHPTHATLLEISRLCEDIDVKSELNRLYLEGKIEVGNTINGKFVKLI
ncbi:hypothetical protein M2459_001367 [Parabacteroides sp. PF5-5]|uniref:hypothetical protein n=1 Tax=unclassified Parabacteroides TaxID=2649774 RepID=UPI002474BACC|nr:MULTISPECIES: hypothetical protein [unclassified Parabacteroides]MDH6304631.1 hypothetical protein [Parabacteroides sp. PH5-39]MDH6315755.1 hypothetical protein [Parabacteroides sp. PF5-13]MDH6319415.1 hypothetical protein [Parabacteroides sp. PH5-13]MDH6323146.1 hypothetical protein [Parabacteroides sp. PH5-8]MDH6326948.1 hypothetical protein [Parabacteroides sp. PH5-41]